MTVRTKKIIAGSVIGGAAGALLLSLSFWWCIRSCIEQSRKEAARVQARREGGGRNDNVELDDFAVAQAYEGVARRREVGVEQPPHYTRTGKPGGVPPVYGKLYM